jgi:hypothetical protein
MNLNIMTAVLTLLLIFVLISKQLLFVIIIGFQRLLSSLEKDTQNDSQRITGAKYLLKLLRNGWIYSLICVSIELINDFVIICVII